MNAHTEALVVDLLGCRRSTLASLCRLAEAVEAAEADDSDDSDRPDPNESDRDLINLILSKLHITAQLPRTGRIIKYDEGSDHSSSRTPPASPLSKTGSEYGENITVEGSVAAGGQGPEGGDGQGLRRMESLEESKPVNIEEPNKPAVNAPTTKTVVDGNVWVCNCKIDMCKNKRCGCRSRGLPCTVKCHKGEACCNLEDPELHTAV